MFKNSDEIMSWIGLVLLELFSSFMVFILIISGILFNVNGYWGFGSLLILLSTFFIALFIFAIKSYLKGEI